MAAKKDGKSGKKSGGKKRAEKPKKAKAVPVAATPKKTVVVSPLAPRPGCRPCRSSRASALRPVEAGVRYKDRQRRDAGGARPRHRDRRGLHHILHPRRAGSGLPGQDWQGPRPRPAPRSSSTPAIPTPSPAATASKRRHAVTAAVAAALGIDEARVFSSSTGVIGQPLPHERITAKIGELAAALSPDAMADAAARDHDHRHFPQGRHRDGRRRRRHDPDRRHRQGVGHDRARHGDDAGLYLHRREMPQPILQRCLGGLIDETFNSITVDSDTSTSDTLLLAATGKVPAAEIRDLRGKPARRSATRCAAVMLDLAHQVVRDGEGATKFVEVRGDRRRQSERTPARSRWRSPIRRWSRPRSPARTRTGAASSWRSASPAPGRPRPAVDPVRRHLVAEKGWVSPAYTEDAGRRLHEARRDRPSASTWASARGRRTVWTCDLTHRYIDINADYRS